MNVSRKHTKDGAGKGGRGVGPISSLRNTALRKPENVRGSNKTSENINVFGMRRGGEFAEGVARVITLAMKPA